MLFSLLSGLVASCRTTRTAMQIGPESAQPSSQPPETEKAMGAGPYNHHSSPLDETQSTPRFGVVLLHGFMNVATEVDPIAASLRDAFGPDVLLIQPSCREQTKSLTRCLEGQAKDVFKTIERILQQANQSAGSFPLFIVGYSHGGLVGCTLAQKQGNKLNIKGIMTINSPLGGVPVLQRTTTDVREFIRDAAEGWAILTQILPDRYEERFGYTTRSGRSYQPRTLRSIEQDMLQMTRGLQLGVRLTQFLPNWMTNSFMGGGKSLLPDDVSVRNVRRFLREDQYTIPCMLLGSYQDDFGSLFDVDPAHAEPMQQFTKAYAKFVAGNVDEKHDTLIPLRSQLCRGPSFESLPTADPNKSWMVQDLPGRPHIQTHIYEGVTHAGNLMVLDDRLFVTGSGIQTLPAARSVLKRVVSFVQEHTDTRSNTHEANATHEHTVSFRGV